MLRWKTKPPFKKINMSINSDKDSLTSWLIEQNQTCRCLCVGRTMLPKNMVGSSGFSVQVKKRESGTIKKLDGMYSLVLVLSSIHKFKKTKQNKTLLE